MNTIEHLCTLLFSQVEYFSNCNAIVVLIYCPILSSDIFKTSQLFKMLNGYKDIGTSYYNNNFNIFFMIFDCNYSNKLITGRN